MFESRLLELLSVYTLLSYKLSTTLRNEKRLPRKLKKKYKGLLNDYGDFEKLLKKDRYGRCNK